MNEEYVLEMENITKFIFNSKGKPIHGSRVKILDRVDFNLKGAEVHALPRGKWRRQIHVDEDTRRYHPAG